MAVMQNWPLFSDNVEGEVRLIVKYGVPALAIVRDSGFECIERA